MTRATQILIVFLWFSSCVSKKVDVVPFLEPTTTATLDELVAHIGQRLARFKIPKSFHIIEALPRTADGKVVKAELREPYWRDHERRVN